MPPSTGYAIADVATLTALGSSDRADGYARLLLDDGSSRRFWVAYDDSATSGDYQPDDTPATGYWNKVESAGRELLTADRIYYVATTGSDTTGDGSSGNPWATPEKAAQVINATLDQGGSSAQIQMADGTYTITSTIDMPPGVNGPIRLTGNTTTPANVIIQSATDLPNGYLRFQDNSGVWFVEGIRFQSTGSTANTRFLRVEGGKVRYGSCDFGPTTTGSLSVQAHIWALGGSVEPFANYTISGTAYIHLWARNTQSQVTDAQLGSSITVTLTGTPAFSRFVTGEIGAAYSIFNTLISFSGSATGIRYEATLNGVIRTGGGGATYFPGNSAGTTATGGQYN